jgi:hypothetical protein
MNPYPRSHPLIRGGFAPFKNGWGGSLTGMGDCGDDNGCGVDSSVFPTTVPSTSLNLSSIPGWAWVIGAVAIFGLAVIPQGPRR